MKIKTNQSSLTRTKKLTGLMVAMFASASAVADNVQIMGLNDLNRIDNQYIVVLKDDQSTQSIYADKKSFVSAAANDISTNLGATVRKQYSHAIMGFAVTADAQQLEALKNNPLVKYIEVDKTFTVVDTQNNATWGLDRLDQQDLPLNQTYNYNYSGNGVHVYIVDTGINANHSEFSNRVGSGYDAVDNDSNPNDCQGHGTHVAGTTAGTTFGVAKDATVHGVRVLNCEGSGQTSDIVEGVDWVIQNNSGDAVINMSLGGSASSAMDEAVEKAWDAGIVTVVAAGNDNSDACSYSPARSNKAITTGSTDNQDRRSSFSNYGNCVDIFAPGSDITSAKYDTNNSSTEMSGTSMASPHVAGAAALYLEKNPGSTPAQVLQGLEDNAIQNTITDVKSGSPNLMLNIDFGSGGTDPEPDPIALENGNSLSISGDKDSQNSYTFEVTEGATDISVSMSGGTGDADLYIKKGSQPTTSSYDCRPYKDGNAESCSLDSSGSYYIMVAGYATYQNVSLLGQFSGGTDPEPSNELKNGKVKNIAGAKNSENRYEFSVPSGSTEISIAMSGGTGDADLYVKLGSAPTTSSYDCRPYKDGNNESCDLTSGGNYHILVVGYETYSGVSLLGQFSEDSTSENELVNGQAKNDQSGSKNEETFYTFTVPAGASNIRVEMSGGTGDADLYIKKGSAPSTSSYDCRPYKDGNNESCSLTDSGIYHVMLRGYETYSGIRLIGSYE